MTRFTENEFLDYVQSKKRMKSFFTNTYVSFKSKYIYFCASKCASSTIKHYLFMKEAESSFYKIKNFDDWMSSPLIVAQQLPTELFLDILDDNQFKKVAFVRNPYMRLISCYVYRVKARNSSPTARYLSKSLNKDPQDISFDDFILFVTNQSARKMDPHWSVITDDILFDIVDYSFIGKVENIRSDIDGLGRHLFPDDFLLNGELPSSQIKKVTNTVLEFPRDNIEYDPFGYNKMSDEDLIKSFYSSITKDEVFKKYAKDFQNFNYFSERNVSEG